MSWIRILACAGGLAGCAATRVPTADDLLARCGPASAQDRASLVAGRALFVDTCSGCHNLPVPARESPGAWRAIVARMVHEEDVPLTGEEQELVVGYLETASACSRPGAAP